MICVKLFVFLCLLHSVRISAQRWTLTLDRYASCPGYEKHSLVYKNAKIRSTENLITANYDITVSKNLPTDMEGTLVIEKCSSKENPNSCMQFYKFRTGKLCAMYAKKTEEWSSFMNCIEPEWICPIKKGAYKARNCTFDISRFRMFPVQSAYWKCKVFMSDPTTKEELGCISFEGEVKKKY